VYGLPGCPLPAQENQRVIIHSLVGTYRRHYGSPVVYLTNVLQRGSEELAREWIGRPMSIAPQAESVFRNFVFRDLVLEWRRAAHGSL
jgi:hypothetical protein